MYLATRAREIICYNKEVRRISIIEYMRAKTKLKMNKANDLSGGKNDFIRPAGKDLESSIFLMLNEVVRHVAMPNEWECMKIKSIYRGKGNKKEMNNQRDICI